MNRNQRKYGIGKAPKRNDSEAKVKVFKVKNKSEIVEVFPPKSGRESIKNDKLMSNRCCSVTPNQKNIGQLTDTTVPTDKYQSLLIDQYGFDPIIPDTIKQLRELKQVLCGAGTRVENCSQYFDADNPVNKLGFVETSEGSQWHNIDNANDIDKYISKNIPEELPKSNYKEIPHKIHISDIPRVKIIAEKFTRYKTNNVELRKLEEKVVCLEYNIYDSSSNGDLVKPVQIMRAFFSIKPTVESDGNGKGTSSATDELPSNIKRNFKIIDGDLRSLNDKEVEIIDEKIHENKPYLDDLKKILKRKQIINSNRNKTSLDLLTLYEMARKEYSPLNIELSSINILSKEELAEVKELILAKCTSSVHDISRRTIKNDKDNEIPRDLTLGVISESIVAELLRENGKINLFQ